MKGRLVEIVEKSGKSVKGPWTLYSLIIATEEGNRTVGCGFDKPDVTVGVVVEVDVEKNARGYDEADLSTLRVLKGEEATAAKAPTQAQALSKMDQKERSIVTQSSYKTAGEVVSAMLANDVLALPAKKADKAGAVLDILDEVAEHIFNACMNPFEVSDNNNEEGDTNDEEGEYNPLG